MSWNADPGSLREKLYVAALIVTAPVWLPVVTVYEWHTERKRRKKKERGAAAP